jgi:integrase
VQGKSTRKVERTKVEPGIWKRRDANGNDVFEITFRDADGRQRRRTVNGGITAARRELREQLGKRDRGEKVAADPRLRFNDAADQWWSARAAKLRDATQNAYGAALKHLRRHFGKRRMTDITASDVAAYVTAKQADGLKGWTIKGHLTVLSSVFTYSARHLGLVGVNPVSLLDRVERPSNDEDDKRPYNADELAQVLAASTEPWRTLFRLAAVIGGRESELLGLWWEDVSLDDIDAATIRFGFQVDRKGKRVPLKTEESKATLPLPRSTARMLAEHKTRSAHSGQRAFVFATATGRPLGQRNVLRALYRAQEHARKADGTPTFPELFEHDERGHLRTDDKGRYIVSKAKRSELPPLPDFHALRHTAAMSADDAEEARDLLRHRNSNVTRSVYRAHFDDKRRESLRAKLEARDVGWRPVFRVKARA